MNEEAQRLYELLPAVYRIRDAQQGGPLKALLAVIAEQAAAVGENLDQLYDDQFVETCADWAIPYIGDLIGYRPLYQVAKKTLSTRAEVANTISYRRRKGTATVLEQLARDVTDWDSRAVEFFQLLITTQYMNHVRPDNHYAPDLRHWEPLERLNTAFETTAHTVDVRRIQTRKGRYNIPNVGLFLWRLNAYALQQSPAIRVDARRYLFSPLGHNMELFTRPKKEQEQHIAHLAEPIHVPARISRRVLDQYTDQYYDQDLSLKKKLSLFIEGASKNDIKVCNLSDIGGGAWAHMPSSEIAIDPVLGRIAFPDDQPADREILVSFHYGFSARISGGQYERRASFLIDDPPDQSLAQGDAIQPALNAVANGGLVEITDNGRYVQTPSITANPASRIEVRAANGNRPSVVLNGDLNISIGAGAEVELNGLLISGGTIRILAVPGVSASVLRLRHCTLVPGLALTQDGQPVSPDVPSLIVEQPDLQLVIDRCITGGLRCIDQTHVEIKDSIIDATDATRVAFSAPDHVSFGGSMRIENSTVIGKVRTRRLDLASNTIFNAKLAQPDPWTSPVHSEQKQTGCVRFSYVPGGAIVPRRYRCQPTLAESEAIGDALKGNPMLSSVEKQAIALGVRARVQPSFTTLRYGKPAYGQLRLHPQELRTGADDESEMGAFHNVFAPQRETNLRIRLDEYLRFGLEAGIIYES